MLFTLLAGLIIGAIASYLRGQQNSLLLDLIIGLVGAFLGRLILGALIPAAESAGSFSIVGILFGVIGAVILLAGIDLIKGYRTR